MRACVTKSIAFATGSDYILILYDYSVMSSEPNRHSIIPTIIPITGFVYSRSPAVKLLFVVPTLLTFCLLGSPAMAQIKVKVQIKGKKIQVKPIQGKKIQVKPIQGQPIRIAFPQNDFILINNKDVQKDLGLSKEQIAKIKEVSEKAKKAMANLKGKERFKKMRELSQANKKAVEDILNPKQNTRIKQLQVQQMGPAALMNPNSSKDLNLTQDQLKEMRTIYRGTIPERRNIFQQNKKDVKARLKKLAELNQKAVKDMEKVLTPEQKKTWQKTTGEPFKGTLPTRGYAFGAIRPGVQAIPLQPRKKIKIQIKKKQPQDKN